VSLLILLDTHNLNAFWRVYEKFRSNFSKTCRHCHPNH